MSTTAPGPAEHQVPPDPRLDPHLDPRVDTALRQLVGDGVLTQEQARLTASALAAAVAPPVEAAAEPASLAARLAEVAGYAGGALVAAAAGLFLRTSWHTLSDAARVAWLSALAVALLLAGAAVLATAEPAFRQLLPLLRAGGLPVRRRLTSALWSLAAGTAGAAVAVGVHAQTPFPAAVVALVLLGPAYAVAPAAVGHLAAFAALVLAAMSGLDEAGVDAAVPYALVLLALAAGWAALTVTGVLRERTLGLAAATGAAFAGVMVPAGEVPWLSHGLGALLALVLFAGYVRARAWPLLVGAVLTTTVVAGQVTSDLVGGGTSRALVVFVAGLVLLGSSAMGLRLRGRPPAG